jgi:hypothetical protein
MVIICAANRKDLYNTSPRPNQFETDQYQARLEKIPHHLNLIKRKVSGDAHFLSTKLLYLAGKTSIERDLIALHEIFI